MDEDLLKVQALMGQLGKALTPDAVYFVLRLDTDKHARYALSVYAECISVEKPEVALNLKKWLEKLETKMGKIHATHPN